MVSPVMGKMWSFANGVTEGRDFIREVWKGIHPAVRRRENPEWSRKNPVGPKDGMNTGYGLRTYKPTTPTPQKMLQDIYKHALNDGPVFKKNGEMYRDSAGNPSKTMDWNKALDNLIQNQASDYFYGQLGRKLGEASAKHRRPIGFGAGDVH